MRDRYSMMFVAALVVGCCGQPLLAFSSGAPDGLTGGPADAGTCTLCHSGTVNAGPGSVTILGVPAQYNFGQVYDLTIRISDPTKVAAGFEVSAQDDLGGHLGTLLLADPLATAFASGNPDYITHTATGVADSLAAWTANGNSAEFPVQWQAPAVDAGPVVFYAVGNAINNATGNNGDNVYQVSAVAGPPGPIPAVSDWGLAAMALLVLAAGTIAFRHNRARAS